MTQHPSIGARRSRCKAAVAALILTASLRAQPKPASPPTAAAQVAVNPKTGIATDRLSAVALYAYQQRLPELTPISLHLTAAFAEADEILQIKDSPDDYACPFSFGRGRITRALWTKNKSHDESFETFELRRGETDVESPQDSNEVSTITGNIKIVGRIEYCNEEGPASLNHTRIYGCSFSNRSFMLAEETLTNPGLRGAVVSHEYGHNVGNTHSMDDPRQVMYYKIPAEPTQGREVTSKQCMKYIGPRRSFYQPGAKANTMGK